MACSEAVAGGRSRRAASSTTTPNSTIVVIHQDFIIDEQTEGRTAQLIEQLMQIAKMSALEEMASGMAHELNQPIGAIATFAQAAERMLAKPHVTTPQIAEVLRHISNEALNAGRGIHRIRKLFDGHEAERVQCDIADILTELTPVVQLLARRYALRLDIDIQPALPQILVDRLRIQHVLFALVQNALEATPPGCAGAEVHIEVTGDRHYVTTAIIDQGTGVSASIRDQMFRPFFTTKPSGTGLGLASARAIVEAHGGGIGFENTGQGGTRFWFRLPAVNVLDAEPAGGDTG